MSTVTSIRCLIGLTGIAFAITRNEQLNKLTACPDQRYHKCLIFGQVRKSDVRASLQLAEMHWRRKGGLNRFGSRLEAYC